MVADTTAIVNISKKYMMKLDKDFYKRDALDVAKGLLGKCLVRNVKGMELKGIITETEAYKATDKACHAYNYKKTKRTSTMFSEGGIAYVYFTYGMYHCFNVVTDVDGEPSAVLIRGLKVLDGTLNSDSAIDYMSKLRYSLPFSELNRYKIKNFSNGPGKLCKAFDITRELNAVDLTKDTLYIADGENVKNIIADKRIGIGYAEEARDYPWRFYYESDN